MVRTRESKGNDQMTTQLNPKIIIMSAFITLSAQAEAKIDEDYCVALGDIAYTVAIERDRGVSKREMRHRAIMGDDKQIRDIVLIIVDAVFERPWDKPEKEADTLERECSFFIKDGQRS